ncbi:hypothetical protein PSQ20_19760 [Curvibacter sp. RS43]|uniref:PH domain-containing protein n=1 Tax=Curvibacter microcysteis TaxID=3026419 RepID=A0ABT5MK34_9BURK|nr:MULTISPECIES: hypothetical protein [unclassified Curvibacter]MDD0812593.1 hypothetical protein [Curvibacter sp. RS43]MDD0816868.1 hypothetical protein [Curvibacter sp. HBC28]
MTDTPSPAPTELPRMGPPPFVFSPQGGRVEGPAFPVLVKVLAVLMVGGCGAWLAQLWITDQPVLHSRSAGVWFLAAQAMISCTAWFIVRSRTRLDSQGLHQNWVGDKIMPLADLAFAKLIRVRGLEWLIAPRLYVRTLSGKFAVFYVASPAVRTECERLIAELASFRRL